MRSFAIEEALHATLQHTTSWFKMLHLSMNSLLCHVLLKSNALVFPAGQKLMGIPHPSISNVALYKRWVKPDKQLSNYITITLQITITENFKEFNTGKKSNKMLVHVLLMTNTCSNLSSSYWWYWWSSSSWWWGWSSPMPPPCVDGRSLSTLLAPLPQPPRCYTAPLYSCF